MMNFWLRNNTYILYFYILNFNLSGLDQIGLGLARAQKLVVIFVVGMLMSGPRSVLQFRADLYLEYILEFVELGLIKMRSGSFFYLNNNDIR